ncbi:hypothetical protein A3Q05_02225 [Lactobacillus johnsonii]|uniref:Uncharacterized protein n=1 Tax=Lactobacillus johnsonii TaxID=33959 RepID=A0A267MCL8_LACJH|nr:hypothetical protein [Lactobacillus taiwanensis]PAB56848.1 hypothetical protein A3Q05_02225 [Lactobacillus johnsonii]PAB57334.1 hypothetical protein A3Q24_00380 [Lactobacillus johnsonii]PEG68830.1 hypothetical protein A3Q04_07505 [Lactobacillus johnsonii]
MNDLFEHSQLISLIFLIFIISISVIYYKSRKSSKWLKLAKSLDKIWIRLFWILTAVFWIEAVTIAYIFIKEFK